MRDELERIAREAGDFFLKGGMTRVSSKEGHANYVTNIDCQVQDYLERALRELLPGSCFIGEEKENAALTDEPTWIVDPLDGTTNLIHDYRLSAVSIALCRGKRPETAVIWQPYTRELYYAGAGKGAFLNGREIHVSGRPFREALVAVGTAPYDEELQETTMALARDYLRSCADIRRSGSAAMDLAWLACGRHEVYFEMKLRPWDYAAGSLILQEAGGRICMPLDGGEMRYDRSSAILAAAPGCMEQALALFRKHHPGACGPTACEEQNEEEEKA